MNTKLFGQYLPGQGLIDRAQMLSVIEEHQASSAEPEDLTIEFGLLPPGREAT